MNCSVLLPNGLLKTIVVIPSKIIVNGKIRNLIISSHTIEALMKDFIEARWIGPLSYAN